jgi:hypothetical protein
MENPARGNSYEEAKRKAKEFYMDIDRVWCPPLCDFVVFNSIGFRHLMWNVAPRPKSEQKRRFALLVHLKKILSASDASVFYEQRKGIHFWIFNDKHSDKLIRVIVRQIDGRQKHFFSVFERKQKSTL